eukprot:TRINITY_DN4769_c0_g1_i1.p1 TRINITY_DN4769_c0_g1~~TRINITY_DN4769_c0_g1_i1.p1  ORF type:complete len:235 (+),score=58.17 TRINITY_DN4769_c0_g1_i1:81-785(+)
MHRSPLKQVHSSNSLKEKLKQNCLKRLKEDRRLFIDSIRGGKENINRLILEEWNSSSLNPSPSCSSPSPICISSSPALLATEKLTGEDYTEVMLFLEENLKDEFFLAAKHMKENTLEAFYEESVKFDEERIMHEMHSTSVVCCLCYKRPIKQKENLLFCEDNSCPFRLQVQKGMDLKAFSDFLSSAVTSHSLEGCNGVPEFSIQKGSVLGGSFDPFASVLWLTCNHCSYISVVL